MKKSDQLYSHLKKHQLIALLTPANVEQCVVAYETFHSLNVILEVALRTDCALDGLRTVIEKYPDALVMAGTVMTAQQAEAAISAGVAGIVSADYIPAVVETCVKHDVMCVPGGLTDAGKQLAKKAELYGCSLDQLREKHPYQWIYKLFPTAANLEAHLKLATAWKGPYKDLTILYSGGLTSGSLYEISRCDPDGIYCGSILTQHADNPDLMRQETEQWIQIIQQSMQKIPPPRKSKAVIPGGKVVTFGEIMLRLSPPYHQRLVQARNFDINYGGAEANVAVSLANFGVDSYFVTALPDHEVGQAAVNSLRSYGVNTQHIIRQGSRIGLYYLEQGASQRPSKVIYDRAGSAISQIKPEQFDWEGIFQGASWFHWTGITPALSDNTAQVIREALQTAKKSGITVSVDLNYRSQLWSKDKAQSVMTELMRYVDICIGNEEDAEWMFGIKAESNNTDPGRLELNAYQPVAEELVKKFGFKKVAITLRESINASENNWSACLHDGKDFLTSRKYKIQVIDRVGAGDAFAAGLIYGMMSGKSDQESLDFATAASCLKHAIPGDFNLVTVKEVEKLLVESTGRIQR